MADITVTTTTTDKARTWPNGHTSTQQPQTIRRTDVCSADQGSRLTVGQLRDLVHALDEAAVPDRALVSHRLTAGNEHLAQLSVHHEQDITTRAVLRDAATDLPEIFRTIFEPAESDAKPSEDPGTPVDTRSDGSDEMAATT